MTSTYAHTRTAFHAHSNQMLTKSLTDLWTRYDAAGTNWAKPQVNGHKVVVAKCIPVAQSTAKEFLTSFARGLLRPFLNILLRTILLVRLLISRT